MKVPVSIAQKNWSRVAVAASRRPVTLTRYGKPWAILTPFTRAMCGAALMGGGELWSFRRGGRYIMLAAKLARSKKVIVIETPKGMTNLGVLGVIRLGINT